MTPEECARMEGALQNILNNVEGLSRSIRPLHNDEAKWYLRIIEDIARAALTKFTPPGD